ncbi:hypothetical protein WAK64_07725 [Bacillus spongiae]|uniref:ABC transporter permease n=1 Tax=Bacillus spongiae TaxID=2683610 RepID=A0ABU8HC89_9BACI
MKYICLLKKELRFVFPTTLIFSILMIIDHVFVSSKMGSWDLLGQMIGAFVIPLLLIPVWSTYLMYSILSNEWKQKSIYMLMSFPVRGWTILSIKIAAIFSAMGFVLLVGIASGYIFFHEQLTSLLPHLFFISFSFIALFSLTLAVIVTFSFLLSRVMKHFRLVTFLTTFLVSAWGMIEVTLWLSPFISWLPILTWNLPEAGPILFHLSSLLILVLFSGGLFLLCCLIYDKRIEVD